MSEKYIKNLERQIEEQRVEIEKLKREKEARAIVTVPAERIIPAMENEAETKHLEQQRVNLVTENQRLQERIERLTATEEKLDLCDEAYTKTARQLQVLQGKWNDLKAFIATLEE